MTISWILAPVLENMEKYVRYPSKSVNYNNTNSLRITEIRERVKCTVGLGSNQNVYFATIGELLVSHGSAASWVLYCYLFCDLTYIDLFYLS
jgi:hypothetical protein